MKVVDGLFTSSELKVYGLTCWSKEQVRDYCKWLRKQAKWIKKNHKNCAATFTARFQYIIKP